MDLTEFFCKIDDFYQDYLKTFSAMFLPTQSKSLPRYRGLQLITPLKSNMKTKLMPFDDKISLCKRSLIETVNDQLKNISYLVHSRHRSLHNFMLNLITSLIAYTHQPKRPSLHLNNSSHEDFFSLVPI
jgi:hypothetical protein